MSKLKPFFSCCAFIAGTALIAGCERSAEPAGRRDAPAKRVTSERVREESLRRNVDVVGTLAAQEEVTVSSQAEGVVKRVLADLGDHVGAGQPLVELDTEKLQYNVDEQKAALARALTKYGANDAGQLPKVEDTPDARKALAELEQARQARERAAALQARQLISKQQLEDAETDLRSKQASYDAALQNARNLRADIDVASAGAKLADRQLRDGYIRAPFEGYVQNRMVSTGELVKSQMPVITIVRVNPLKLTAEIPEKMAPWVKVGQPLTLQVDAYPGKSFTATVSRISPTVNTQTRTFSLEAAAPNSDGLLKPGTFARARLETALVENVLTIPYNAMQYRYGTYRAFTVDGDKLTMHELKTGDRLGDRMEVVDGVKADNLIATTDVDNLADGMKVTAARAE